MNNDCKISDEKLDEIYRSIDVLMIEGSWNFLNELFFLWAASAWKTDLDVLLAYATASFPAKSKILSRKYFMECCMSRYPDEKLWKGLK